jgi:transketolase N-terminal domain/subunit
MAAYSLKNDDEKVVLSSGHAGLALYVILEAVYGPEICNAEVMLEEMGIHPCRDIERNVHVSTGSLGCGILIAAGMALADRNKNVYCIISDGEAAEGSVWEALAFAEKNKLDNLVITVNANGYSAYDEVDTDDLYNRLVAFFPNIVFCKTNSNKYTDGLAAHYKVMTEGDYNRMIQDA